MSEEADPIRRASLIVAHLQRGGLVVLTTHQAVELDDVGAVDAQETAVQLCLPLRNAGFGAVGEAPGGVNPHFAVVRFDVADFRGVERDFAAVGDETDRTGVGTAAFEVFFESYFRSDEGRQDQQGHMDQNKKPEQKPDQNQQPPQDQQQQPQDTDRPAAPQE